MKLKPDILAEITLTRKNPVKSGYRPAHLVGDYLTTGVHQYLYINELKSGETAQGTVTFITPEEYPHSLEKGMKITFQEGAKVTGYLIVLEVYNDILKK